MNANVNTSEKQNQHRNLHIKGMTASKAEVYADVMNVTLQDFGHIALEYYFEMHPLTITKIKEN